MHCNAGSARQACSYRSQLISIKIHSRTRPVSEPRSREISGDLQAIRPTTRRPWTFGRPAGEDAKMGSRHFGASVVRLEDPRFLKGAGRYLDDIQMPGVLHGAFVRSQSAHAHIKGLDESAALALPGVAA